jgi:hypothetical protein
MFTVVGKLANGEEYTARVGAEFPDHGCFTGTPNIVSYLACREGEHYRATPTGPSGLLSVHDPESVFAALLGWTTVWSVAGDVPDILGGQPQDGTVY